MLTATPLHLAAAADTTGAAEAKIQSQLVSIFQQGYNMGAGINADITTEFATSGSSVKIDAPLLNQSLEDIFSSGSSRAVGRLFQGDNNTAFSDLVNAYFNGAAAPGLNTATSDGLATYLSTQLNANASSLFGGSNFTISVADNSNDSTKQLKLDFSISQKVVNAQAQILNFGDVAQELNLALASDADVSLTATRTVKFSIMADLSSMGVTATTGGTATGLDNTKFRLDVSSANGNGAWLSADINHTSSSYIGDFGLGIGIIEGTTGANGTGQGAYAHNSTMQWDLSAKINWADADDVFNLDDLASANSTGWASQVDVQMPVGQTNFSGLASNQTKLILNYNIRNDQFTSGSTRNPDYIGGLGSVAGVITVTDLNLLDNRLPVLDADQTTQLFARIDAKDMLDMFLKTADWADDLSHSSLYDINMPFIDQTLGGAYDFGKAFSIALTNQLSFVENILTSTGVPIGSGGATSDFNGKTSFVLTVGGAAYAISLDPAPSANSRDTLNELISALNNALDAALPGSGAGVVQARRVQGSDFQGLEFYSVGEANAFALTQINSGLTGAVTSLGLRAVNQVVVLGTGTVARTVGGIDLRYQVPGASLSTGTTINPANFNSGFSFNVTLNGGTSKTVSIPVGLYSSLDAVTTAIQTALIQNGIYDPATLTGVAVKLMTNPATPTTTETSYITFYALNGVESFQLSDVTSGNLLAKLKLTPATATNPNLMISINGGTAQKVVLNGNFTNGLIGAGASSMVDLTRFLNDSLTKAGLSNETLGTGLAFQAIEGVDKLYLFARNAGAASNQIANFTVTGTAALLTQLGLPSGTTSSQSATVSSDIRQPKFKSVQGLARIIDQAAISLHPIDTATAGNPPILPSFDNSNTGATAKMFSFPIAFTVGSGQGLTNQNDVGLALGNTYGDINGIVIPTAALVDSTADISRSVTARFNLEFKLQPTTTVAEPALVSLTPNSLDWDGKLYSDARMLIGLGDGNMYALDFTAASTASNDSYEDFADQLLAKINTISQLNGKFTIEKYSDADTGIDLINLRSTYSKTIQIDVPLQLQSALNITNLAVSSTGPLGLASGTTTGTGSPSTVVGTKDITAAFTEPTTALFINFNLPDGTSAQLAMPPELFAGVTTAAALLDAVKLQIASTPPLMYGDFTSGTADSYAPRVDAFLKTVGSATYLAFRLNSTVYPTGTLSVTVPATYSAPQDNGFSAVDVNWVGTYFGESNSVASELLATTGLIPAPFSLSHNAVFAVTVGGSSYGTVTVPATTVTTGRTIATLIGEINAALAATNVTFQTTGGPVTRPLSDYIVASVYGQPNQIALRLRTDIPGSIPQASSWRMAPDTTVANNAATAELGFQPKEQMFQPKGAERYLNNITIDGSASALGLDVDVNGNMGFIGFTSTAGGVTSISNTRAVFSKGTNQNRFTFDELESATLIGGLDDITGSIASPGLATMSGSTATLVLKNVAFLNDAASGSVITGLGSLGTGAAITISYGTINNVKVLPTVSVTYNNAFKGMEKLAKLTFQDVFDSLARSGEVISDYMRESTTPLGQDFLFIQQLALSDLFDLGDIFSNAVFNAFSDPATNLQQVRQKLITSMGLDPTALTLGFGLTFDTTTGNLTTAKLNVGLDFLADLASFSFTLPMFIDLGKLRNRNESTSLISDYLAGISTLTPASSNNTNSLDLHLSGAGRLNLRAGVDLVSSGTMLIPTPQIYNTTTIEQLVNLGGEGLTGDIPVATVRLHVAGGAVAVNKTGEAAVPDQYGTPAAYNTDLLLADAPIVSNKTVRIASTAAFNATYIPSTSPSGVGSTLRANAVGSINTLALQGITTFAVGDLILVNHQANAAQNGIYRITDLGRAPVVGPPAVAGAAYVLARVNLSGATSPTLGGELDTLKMLRVAVTEGTYANRVFRLDSEPVDIGTSLIRFARLIDPAKYTTTFVANRTLPRAVTVATTAALSAVYNNGTLGVGATLTASANQWINSITVNNKAGIDGFKQVTVGDLILVKDQPINDGSGNDLRYQNGVYEVIQVGQDGTVGSKWVLRRVAWADSSDDLSSLRLSVLAGDTYGNKRFIQTGTATGTISAGKNFLFAANTNTTNFNLIYNGWETTTAVGQAIATLPISIITHTGGTATTEPTEKTFNSFPPLVISIPNSYNTSGVLVKNGLDMWHDPTNNPFAVRFTSLPDWRPAIGASNPLNLLRDPLAVGDYLDLALFNLQMAIDQTLGNQFPIVGAAMGDYTVFVEAFRSRLTNAVRSAINADKLRPMTQMRQAIFDVLGPTGFGYLTSLSSVDFKVLDSSGVDTGWNFGLGTADPDGGVAYNSALHGYILQNGKVSEIVKPSATTIEISFKLEKLFDTDATAVTIPNIDLFAPGLGMTIGSSTNLGTGGIQFKRSWVLNFGVGVDITDGFFVKAGSRNAAGALISGAAPDMYIKVEAALDGNINATGIQKFAQSTLGQTTWNNFDAQVVDAQTTPGGRASGFYGEFIFNYQSGSGTKANRLVLSDLQTRLPVGDSTIAGAPLGIMDYTINADVDLHLIVMGSNSVVQGIQADLIMSARYGSGAPQLSFPAATTPNAAGNLNASDLGLATVADDFELPVWRYNRTTISGGHTDIALMNITVDAEAYRQNSVIKSLSQFWSAYQPIKPIVDFFASPIPGISSLLPAPIIPIDIIGKQFGYKGLVMAAMFKIFQAFGQGVEDTLVNQSVSTIPTKKWVPTWQRPRVEQGSVSSLGLYVVDPAGKWQRNQALASEAYKKIGQGFTDATNYVRDWYNNRNVVKPDAAGADAAKDDSKPAKELRDAFNSLTQTRVDRIGAALSSAAGTVVSAGASAANWASDKVKSGIKSNNAAVLEKKKEEIKGKTSPIIGITGGGFRYDLFWPQNLTRLLLGQEANVFFVEVPRLEIGVSYTKYFPLPPFPALGITIGASFSVYASFNLGVDSRGFYFSTVNNKGIPTPVFGAQVRVSGGASLSIAIFEAGVEVFVQLNVDFAWNTDYGSTKLRQSQIDFLRNYPTTAEANAHMGNLFDVTISLTIGITFFVDIDTFFFSARILEKTFSKTWSWLIAAPDPGAQLGYYDAATKILYLNMGYQNPTYNSGGRIFGDIQPLNENFVLTHLGGNATTGESLRISTTLDGFAITQDFSNVMLVKGWAGRGTSIIDASSLTIAVVNFYGGNGINILKAGAGASNAVSLAYGEAGSGGRNYLYGGLGSSTLTGGSGAAKIVGGKLNSVIQGGNGSDTLVSGFGSDIIRGSASGATFVFYDNFRRDRLYVTGLNNTVDLSNVTTSVNFNIGKIVSSASTGSNFLFVTPTDGNRINTWKGTNVGDNVTITYFPPNSNGSPTPLTFLGGTGVNFYTVYLGDPKAKLNNNTTTNLGKIQITDSNASSLSSMIVRATTSEALDSFSPTLVENGRETLVIGGMTRVSLDAGDSVVTLGKPGVEWTDLGTDIFINAGTFIMLGNIEAKNLTLSSKNSFLVTQHINIRDNGYLTIELKNPDPNGFSNLLLGPASPTSPLQNPQITISSRSQIYNRTELVIDHYETVPVISWGGYGWFFFPIITWEQVPVYVASALPPPPRGDGTGTLTLKVAGSIINSTATPQGSLKVQNGRLIFDIRDSLGVDGNPIHIDVQQINGRSTGTNGGVFLYSEGNLTVRQATASTDFNGITTANGKIDIEMAVGKKLTVGFLSAGGGADIRLAADDIDIIPNYTVWGTTTVTYTGSIDFTAWYGSWATSIFPPNGIWTYSYTFTYDTATSTLGTIQGSTSAGGGKVSDLYIENVTDKKGIEVGGTTATTTGTLFLSDTDLSAIKAGFGTVFIGRQNNGLDALGVMTTHPITGKVTIHDYTFLDSVHFRGSEINALPLAAGTSLRAKNLLQMTTYKDPARSDALNGDIVVGTGTAGNVSAILASTVEINAAGDLTLTRAISNLNLLGNAVPNGAINLAAGLDPVAKAGNLTITGLSTGLALTSSANGGTISMQAGQTSGDIILTNVNISVKDLVFVRALAGAFTVLGTSSISGSRFNSITKKGLIFSSGFDELELVRVTENTSTPQGITIVNNKALVIDSVSTANGNISITTTTGGMTVDQIDAGLNRNVTLTSAGAIDATATPVYAVSPNLYNVRGSLLTLSAAGEIVLTIDALTLSAVTSVLGDIYIEAITRGITLNNVQTFNGLIEVTAIQTGQFINAKNVVSLTSNAANTITLDTGVTNNGNITVGVINGGVNGDVFLSAAGLVLRDTTLASGNPFLTGSSEVTAKNLDVQALGSATVLQPNIIDLYTNVVNVVAGTSSGTGNIVINERNGLNLESVITFGGDIAITAAGTITYDTVQAPNRRVMLNSTGGSILKNPDVDTPTDDDIIFATFLDARANNNLVINSTVNDLIVKSLATGTVTITNSTGVTLREVTTNSGNIDITTGAVNGSGQIVSVGNALLGIITAGSTALNDIKLTIYGSAQMAPATPAPVGLPLLTDGVPNALVKGRNLDMTGLNTITLKTDLASIDVDTIAPGILTINDIGSVEIARAITNEGSIHITAQGSLQVIDIQAGGVTNQIDLDATTGNITQASGRLVSDFLFTDAVTGIQVLTNVNEATAHVSGTGNLTLNELDTILLRELTTFNGDITVTSGGTITTDRVDAGLSTHDITITSGGSIARVSAPQTTYNLRGDLLTLDAAGSIIQTINANTVNAQTTVAGQVLFDAVGRAITIDLIEVFNGQTVVNAVQAGQTITVNQITSLTSNLLNTVTLNTGTVTDGDIIIGGIDAKALGDVFIRAGGQVLQDGSNRRIIGLNLDILALGKGSAGAPYLIDLLTDVDNLIAQTGTTAGAGLGDYRFHNLGTINLQTVRTYAGHINITATGGMTIDQVDAGASPSLFDITLNATGGGITKVASPTAPYNLRGDVLTLDAAGQIVLTIDANTLNAQTSAAGNALFDAITRPLYIDLIETANGKVVVNAVQTGQTITVNQITSLTDNAANTVTLNTGAVSNGDIIIGGIDAKSTGDIFIIAGGRVLQDGSTRRVIGNDLDVLAKGIGTGGTPYLIDLLTDVDNLIAKTVTGVGNFMFHNLGDINLQTVFTYNGDIRVTTVTQSAALGSITYGDVHASNAAARNQYVFLTADGNITTNGGASDLIVSDLLDARAKGYLVINSAVSDLIAKSTVAGSITITNSLAATYREITTKVGDITITNGVVGQTTKNVLFGVLTAGDALQSDLYLTIYGSAAMAPALPAVVTRPKLGDGVANSLISGDELDMTGDNNINIKTDLGFIDIDTIAAGDVTVFDIGTVDVRRIITFLGSINVTAQVDLIVRNLQANGAGEHIDLEALTGGITQPSDRLIAEHLLADAITGIQVVTKVQDVIAHVTGVLPSSGVGDMLIDELDDLELIQLTTFNGTTTVNAGGFIHNDPTHTTPVVDSKGLILNSVTGVGLPSAGTLVVNADWIESRATTSGGIYIHNLKGAELRHILANNGEIEVLTDGAMIAGDVQTFVDATSNTIKLTTSIGDMLLNLVQAGANGGRNLDPDTPPGPFAPLNADTYFTSAGSINHTNPYSEYAQIMARGLIFDAQTGVGNLGRLTFIGRLLSARTTTGDLIMGNVSPDTFTIIGLYTGHGNIDFTMEGGGDLLAYNIRTGFGDIKLAQLGTGDFLVNHVFSGGGTIILQSVDGGDFTGTDIVNHGGTITIETKGGGDLHADHVRNDNGTTNIGAFGGGTLDVESIRAGHGNINLVTQGGGNLFADEVTTQNGNLFMNARSGATVFLQHSYSNGNTTLQGDEVDLVGGPSSVLGTGTLSIFANSPTVPVYLQSPFARPGVLDITNEELRAFGGSFQSFVAGNPFAPDMTFFNYQVVDGLSYPTDEFINERRNQTFGLGAQGDQGHGHSHLPGEFTLPSSTPSEFLVTGNGWDEAAFEDEGTLSYPDDVPANTAAARSDEVYEWQASQGGVDVVQSTSHDRLNAPIAIAALPVLIAGRAWKKTQKALSSAMRLFLF